MISSELKRRIKLGSFNCDGIQCKYCIFHLTKTIKRDIYCGGQKHDIDFKSLHDTRLKSGNITVQQLAKYLTTYKVEDYEGNN
jgi:hypothetical protein